MQPNQHINNRIVDYTYFSSSHDGRPRELANAEISALTKQDISFLLREKIFVDIALEIAINILEKEDININVFHKEIHSVDQRELISVLILTDDYYWHLYPNLYYSLQNILKDQLQIVWLPDYIKDHFKHFNPEKLVWTVVEHKWYENMIHNDAAITVNSAYGRIRQLKRAILHGNTIEFQLNNEVKLIDNLQLFNALLVNNLISNTLLKEHLVFEKIMHR